MATKEPKWASLLPRYTEEGTYSTFSGYEGFHVKTITLKGRLEFRKDYKAILYAASQTPGISSVKYDGFAVEITWLSEGTGNDGEVIDLREDAYRHIATFVKQVKKAPNQPCLRDLGLETHVFWQSLKPINQYDGERDGIWARENNGFFE